jgi:hypothetical protein
MNITLNFGTEETPRNLSLDARAASMAASDDVTAIDEKRMKALTPLIAEEKTLEERFKNNDPQAIQAQFELKRRVAAITFAHDVELVQKIALRKDLTTEDKVLFDSDANMHFWRSQDLSEVRRFLAYFRGLLG